MKVTVFGAGAYGISLALMLAKKKENDILVCTHNESVFNHFKENRKFTKLPKAHIPENVNVTNDYEYAMKETSLIFLVPSVKYIKDICNKIKPYYKNQPICIAAKGIENDSLEFSSELVRNILWTNNISLISGPTFAEDLANNSPAALAIAGYNKKTIDFVIKNLANETLKLRPSSDIKGIQLCGSVKNIIAIASGIIKGLGYSESTEAFLINESLHDMKMIIHALGGKKKTILSFAGVGDLLLTCTSTKSRNYSFGYIIGSTKDKKEIDNYLKNNTVEGYWTLNSIYKLLQKKGISIPLIDLLYDVVYNNQDPSLLIDFLINKA